MANKNLILDVTLCFIYYLTSVVPMLNSCWWWTPSSLSRSWYGTTTKCACLNSWSSVFSSVSWDFSSTLCLSVN
jgi:hypothetical protein